MDKPNRTPPCEEMIKLLRQLNNGKGELIKAAKEKLDPHVNVCKQCKLWVKAVEAWFTAAEERLSK